MAREEAPGIPKIDRIHPIRQVKGPEAWELCLQRHAATRAGVHTDLRLGDPRKKLGHSWALRYWPKRGEKRLAVRQPTHTLDYFDFSGRISAGQYGAGTVKLLQRGKAMVVASGNKKVVFAVPKGKKKGAYALIATGKKAWLLIHLKVSP